MDTVAKIFINNVEVGFIPLEQYEKIKKDTYKSKKNYMLQAIEFFTFILKLMSKTISFIPVTLIILLITILIIDSNSLVEFISLLKVSSPESIVNIIKNALYISFMITLIAVIVSYIFSYGKINNVFNRAIEDSILQLLEIPERGNVFIQVEK